jgi:MFS family permease
MTDIRAGAGEDQRERSQPGGSSYLAVLRSPGALRFSVAAAVGRVPMSMYGLGSLLLIAALTGRYGLAGTVSAAGSVGYAAFAPMVARLADRFGQGRVLRPTAVAFAIATAGFITAVELRAPLAVLLASGCVAGALMPSLGSMVRARWSVLLAGQPQRLGTAYALESVIDEIIFVVGPAVVTLLATEVSPPAGVLTAAVVCVGGTLALAAQSGTEPPVQPPAPGGGRRAREGGRLPAAGLVILTPLFIFLGAMFASIDLSTVDFAQEQGHKPLAGLLLGCYALGSAVGGIWYGSRTWRAPLERRFAMTLFLAICGVGTFWLVPSLGVLSAAIFVAGLAISPTLIAGFGLIERQAPASRRTEGMTWLSSSISVGVAAGAAIAGHIVDAGGARWGYGFAACCGGVAVITCVAGLGRLRLAHAGQPAQ